MTGQFILQYISDLHLETQKKILPDIEPLIPGMSYLILAGDIGNPYHEKYRNFLQINSQKFNKVFIVSGNHEYYSNAKQQRTISDIDLEISKLCSRFENIHYLQQKSFNLHGWTLAGCTLWSSIPDQPS